MYNQHAKGILAHNSRARFFCSNTNVNPSGFPKFNPSLALYQKAEISLCMVEREICSLLPEDYTDRFHLVENVLEEADNFLESIPENLTEDERARFSLETFSPYSSMTSLYSSVGNRGKVDEILREMKENNVKLDSLTVNNVLRVYAAESDVRSMKKLLAGCETIATLQVFTALDMAKAYLRVERSERASEVRDHKSYKELMRLYGEEGKSEDAYHSSWYRSYSFIFFHSCAFHTMLVSGFHKMGMVKQVEILMKDGTKDVIINQSLLCWKSGKKWESSEAFTLERPYQLSRSLSDSNYKFTKALEVSSGLCEKEVINLFFVINLFPEDILRKCWKLISFSKETSRRRLRAMLATLLNTYTRCYQKINKAEAIFEKMGELGVLSKLFLLKLMGT
ncbi:LOW QUALITY PROTEIN: hypothetical protein HID58_035241 [Brassica napus]|uniref:Pentatricopeptide repeat-containing protein n=1 Tax=Brassica napus TaxID=3708 RepID=A0ABQ8C664_BRANA|nr:LOW QUALITY PROTEIN: hypothetical protein HID58_035241 [Brassica napus]